MNSLVTLSSRFALIIAAGLVSPQFAVAIPEVASPSNLFPSPTGIYRNAAAANVIYGATVQIKMDHCHSADKSLPPPTGTSAGTYLCGETAHFRVVSGGSTTPVFVSVPMDISFRLTPSAMGMAGVLDLEVLSLSATSLPGGIMIRESPTLQSTGQHTIRQVPSGNYYVSSFFDVFTEISADGGATWIPGSAAMHFELTEPELLVATENQLPPAGSAIKVPGKIEFPNLVQVSDLQLKPSPATITSLPLNGNLYQTTEKGKATGQVSADGGTTFAPFACEFTATKKYQAKSKTSEAYFYDEELVALNLSGGTLPAGMRIRESPTKASLGRASSRRAPDGLYRIGSFFDVFFECSLNNGATWSPNDGSPCYITNSHGTPGVDVAAFAFNPTEITSAVAKSQPSSHSPALMTHFENGDVPTQEDLIEYPSGTIIRGLSFSLPSSAVKPPALGAPPLTQNIDITVQCEVSSDGGVSYEPVRGTATASVRINAVAVGAGASAALHTIEWLALDFSTTLGSGGTLQLRESPTKSSTGKTAMRAAPDGTSMISSFFDIFTELSRDGGTTWESGGALYECLICHARTVQVTGSSSGPPLRWNAPEILREQITTTSDFPPAESVLSCPSDIYASNGVVLRRVMIHKIHNGSNLPNPGASKTFTFTTTASGELSTDGGVTFRDWVGDCTGSIGLTDFLDDDSDHDGVDDIRFFNGELLALDLGGGGLGAVRVRESPTKASLGRTSVRTTPSSSFGQLSFFDVFTEISTDNGATWTPSSGLPVSMGFKAPPQEHFFPSVCVPICGDYVCSDPVVLSSSVTLYRMRKRPDPLYQAWDNEIADRVIPSSGIIEGEISTDGGATRQAFQTTYTENLLVGYDRADGTVTFDCRDFAFAITSGGATIQIRESPTLPSLGRAMFRQCLFNTGRKGRMAGHMVQSFFDIFTEVSFDNGLVWSPRSNLLRLNLEPTPAQDNAFATNFFPPRDGAFEAEPGAPPILYGSNVMVRDLALDGFATSQPLTSASGARTISCQCRCKASFDGGQTWSSLTVPASFTFTVVPTSIEDKYVFTVTAMGVSSASFMLRESPTLLSQGQTTIRTKPAGYTGNGTLIDSFFDIFTEISLDGGGTWTPAAEACRLNCSRVGLEVATDQTWGTEAHATHRAVDPDFELHFVGTDATVSGLVIGSATSVEPDGPLPAEASGGVNQRTCSCPTGYYISGVSSTPKRRQLQFGWIFWTEQNKTTSGSQQEVDIELSGLSLTTDLPGVMLRESPTRASTGRQRLVLVPGSFGAGSQVRVFLELSLDGGQTWHAATTALEMESVDASRPKRFGIGSTDPLPPLFKAPRNVIKTYFETGDKPTQAQFAALIDSTLNFVDDRQLIGLRHYDAVLEYQAGDTGVVTRTRPQLTFGYVFWTDPKLTADRTTYNMDITQFDMSGGTMPAGMKLRESPSLPSRGRCERVTNPDGSVSVLSFFDVFTEISHDNGATWSASDLPLHFEAEDEVMSSLTHSDHFMPQGIYKQSSTPIRCSDGTCAASVCDFTSPPAPLPSVPGVATPFTASGLFTSSFTRNGASSSSVSANVNMEVNLTLIETVGSTRYFDAEVLSLGLTGTISPAEFRIRESPTKASLGRHTVTNVGSGNYRISSFFDVWTEISVDGGQTWAECDVPMHLELAAPELDVRLEPSTDLIAGVSTIDFGYLLTGSTATRNILISNHGQVMLSDFGMANLSTTATDFTFAPPTTTTLAPGSTITVPITFTATTAGTRTTTLRITSNDSDESPFDITLTARALSPTGDDDGDGLTNQQEINLVTNPLYSESGSPFVNPLHNDSDRLAFFRNNGLFLTSDVQALNMDVPLLQKLPGTNQFKLIFGVQKSSDLIHFDPFPLSAPQSTINAGGKLEFLFTVPDGASFFRVQSP
ncbi:MAG: choice-of-anchor D domain-containing protein [Verrucomicrobiaceae bacterium]|nr:choice-of-anchor D domain-containing protein [Verrucomicrobiaceae bacterium]